MGQAGRIEDDQGGAVIYRPFLTGGNTIPYWLRPGSCQRDQRLAKLACPERGQLEGAAPLQIKGFYHALKRRWYSLILKP